MRRIPMYPVETVNSCTTPWEPWGVSTSSSCSTTSSSSMHSGPLPSQLWSHAGRQRERGLSHNQTLTPAIPVTRDQIPRMCDIDIYKYAGSISRRVAVVTSQGGGGALASLMPYCKLSWRTRGDSVPCKPMQKFSFC